MDIAVTIKDKVQVILSTPFANHGLIMAIFTILTFFKGGERITSALALLNCWAHDFRAESESHFHWSKATWFKSTPKCIWDGVRWPVSWICIIVAWFTYPLSTPFRGYKTLKLESEKIKKELDDANREITSLQEQRDTIRDSHTALDVIYDRLQGDHNTLLGNHTIVMGERDTFRAERDTLRDNYTSLKLQHDQLRIDYKIVARLNEDVDALGGKVEELSEQASAEQASAEQAGSDSKTT